MRLYVACNYYLSSIQQGIQAAHCLGELVNKYQFESGTKSRLLREWLKNHKTMIVLNGGNCRDLEELYKFFVSKKDNNGWSNNWYPFASFCEDEQSLNKSLTAVGIILPESVYNIDTLNPVEGVWKNDFEIACKLKSLPLAR